jgi:hypothetical protein
MPLGRRSSRQADDSPRGIGPFLKRWTIPIIGAITPVGLIVVNIAAFIVKHLSEFRWSITIAAFVSSMMLNSWMALNVYRVVQRRRPEHSLDRNQEMALVGGMAVVIVFSVLAALFCYWGLSDPNSLPNAATFVSGALAIVIPIVLQGVFGRERRRPRGGGGPVDARVSPGPRGTPTQGQSSGYTPPRYLPPS